MQFDYVLMFGVVRSVYTASYGHLGSLLRGPYIRATFSTLSRVLIVRVPGTLCLPEHQPLCLEAPIILTVS